MMPLVKTTWFEIGLEVDKNKNIYILGKDRFYGPYKLHNAERRMLKNSNGNVFMNYPDGHLYLEKKGE